jgi:fibronectin type 3 domain-containing protein
VTLSWSAPTQNSNGTALTNLAGYRIYYGTSASAMTQTVTISSVGVMTHVLSNLNAQTYYFGVMAYNTAGVESKLSNLVSKTL